MTKIGEDEIGLYHRIWVPVAPGVETYGLYIVPKKAKLPAPLVISLHGGGGIPEGALFHGGTNYHDQIRGAVQQGYVVWAPLFIMQPFADRNKGTEVSAEIRKELDAKIARCGNQPHGDGDDEDHSCIGSHPGTARGHPARVAMIGLSYGGYYTFYISAVEPRIKVAIASCSFRNTPAAKDGVTEGRPIDLTSPDQVALVAPRPLQIQAGINDKSAPIDTVRETIAQAKRDYEKTGSRTFSIIRSSKAAMNGAETFAWKFLAKYL